MKKTRLQWPRISEDEQEYRLTRETAAVLLFEELDPDSQKRLTSRHVDGFPEKVLLAFVTNEVKGWLARLDRERDDDGTIASICEARGATVARLEQRTHPRLFHSQC